VLAYLIVRGHTMHEHHASDQSQLEAFRQYVRSAPSAGMPDDLHKLAELKDRGVLTQEEFERAKARVLA
jgi:hypothetical protein